MLARFCQPSHDRKKDIRLLSNVVDGTLGTSLATMLQLLPRNGSHALLTTVIHKGSNATQAKPSRHLGALERQPPRLIILVVNFLIAFVRSFWDRVALIADGMVRTERGGLSVTNGTSCGMMHTSGTSLAGVGYAFRSIRSVRNVVSTLPHPSYFLF